MTIALTGATGNLGRLVIDELLERNVAPQDIVAIVRNPQKAQGLKARGLTVRVADYGNPSGWGEALQGVDKLLLISVSGAGASCAHATVIDAAKEAGVGHIAYTSILNAETSTNPLAPEHFATEKLIVSSGLNYTILRNAWYHELYTRLIPEYLATKQVAGSVQNGKISGAARADFAAAAAQALTSDGHVGRVYELGGTEFGFEDIAQVMTKLAGQKISHDSLTDSEFADRLRDQGFDEGIAKMLVASDASIRNGHMNTSATDLQDLVGRPLRTLAQSFEIAMGK